MAKNGSGRRWHNKPARSGHKFITSLTLTSTMDRYVEAEMQACDYISRSAFIQECLKDFLFDGGPVIDKFESHGSDDLINFSVNLEPEVVKYMDRHLRCMCSSRSELFRFAIFYHMIKKIAPLQKVEPPKDTVIYSNGKLYHVAERVV